MSEKTKLQLLENQLKELDDEISQYEKDMI